MAIKNKRNPTNQSLEGEIVSVTDKEKKILKDAGVGGDIDTEMSDTSENAVQNKVIKKYIDGKAVSIDDFDSTLFSMENNKISITNLYNDNGIFSLSNGYSVDIKDYIKVIDDSGNVLVDFEKDNTEVKNHLQCDGSMEVVGDATFKGIVEVNEPTTDGQVANKKYVDDAISSAASFIIRRYS